MNTFLIDLICPQCGDITYDAIYDTRQPNIITCYNCDYRYEYHEVRIEL